MATQDSFSTSHHMFNGFTPGSQSEFHTSAVRPEHQLLQPDQMASQHHGPHDQGSHQHQHLGTPPALPPVGYYRATPNTTLPSPASTAPDTSFPGVLGSHYMPDMQPNQAQPNDQDVYFSPDDYYRTRQLDPERVGFSPIKARIGKNARFISSNATPQLEDTQTPSGALPSPEQDALSDLTESAPETAASQAITPEKVTTIKAQKNRLQTFQNIAESEPPKPTDANTKRTTVGSDRQTDSASEASEDLPSDTRLFAEILEDLENPFADHLSQQFVKPPLVGEWADSIARKHQCVRPPAINPHEDHTIRMVIMAADEGVELLIQGMDNFDDVVDDEGSKEIKLVKEQGRSWKKATAMEIMVALIRRCVLGYYGHEKKDGAHRKDMNVNCAARLLAVYEALKEAKMVCRDVFFDPFKVEALVHAPFKTLATKKTQKKTNYSRSYGNYENKMPEKKKKREEAAAAKAKASSDGLQPVNLSDDANTTTDLDTNNEALAHSDDSLESTINVQMKVDATASSKQVAKGSTTTKKLTGTGGKGPKAGKPPVPQTPKKRGRKPRNAGNNDTLKAPERVAPTRLGKRSREDDDAPQTPETPSSKILRKAGPEPSPHTLKPTAITMANGQVQTLPSPSVETNPAYYQTAGQPMMPSSNSGFAGGSSQLDPYMDTTGLHILDQEMDNSWMTKWDSHEESNDDRAVKRPRLDSGHVQLVPEGNFNSGLPDTLMLSRSTNAATYTPPAASMNGFQSIAQAQDYQSSSSQGYGDMDTAAYYVGSSNEQWQPSADFAVPNAMRFDNNIDPTLEDATKIGNVIDPTLQDATKSGDGIEPALGNTTNSDNSAPSVAHSAQPAEEEIQAYMIHYGLTREQVLACLLSVEPQS